MRVCCTRELANKIKAIPLIESGPGQKNGWYAKVFRHQRKQYIAAIESNTLVTVLFYGIGINSIQNFERALRQSIINLFARRGWASLLDQQVSFDTDGIKITKILDRRIMGSRNEMTRLANYEIEHSDSLDIATDRINEAPMSLINSAPEWLLDKMIGKKAPTNRMMTIGQ